MILVTGATGFLGAQLCVDLLKSGNSVRALKRPQSKIPPCLVKPGIEWFQGDLLDYFSLEDALSGIDKVYHCAAKVELNSKKRQDILQNNIKGTANVVNACLNSNINKLLHVSSIAAITNPTKPNEFITEDHLFEPSIDTNPYRISKYESEREVWRGIHEGLNAVIVNPSLIIGGMNDWTQGTGLLFRQVEKGLPFYPPGGNGFVDVRDVSQCMIKLMDSPFSRERFIINGENMSFKTFFLLISKELNVASPPNELKGVKLKLINGFFSLCSLLKTQYKGLNQDIWLTSCNRHFFSNEKIKKYINREFIPIEQSIKEACQRRKA